MVYKVLNSDNEILALKCVQLKDLPPNLQENYINEVRLLSKLRNKPGIVNLIDYELNISAKELRIVWPFEGG